MSSTHLVFSYLVFYLNLSPHNTVLSSRPFTFTLLSFTVTHQIWSSLIAAPLVFDIAYCNHRDSVFPSVTISSSCCCLALPRSLESPVAIRQSSKTTHILCSGTTMSVVVTQLTETSGLFMLLLPPPKPRAFLLLPLLLIDSTDLNSKKLRMASRTRCVHVEASFVLCSFKVTTVTSFLRTVKKLVVFLGIETIVFVAIATSWLCSGSSALSSFPDLSTTAFSPNPSEPGLAPSTVPVVVLSMDPIQLKPTTRYAHRISPPPLQSKLAEPISLQSSTTGAIAAGLSLTDYSMPGIGAFSNERRSSVEKAQSCP